jgi:hypothetical protein
MAYVNHHAMSELFDPLRTEANPQQRWDSLTAMQTEFGEHLLALYEQTAYELKALNWNTGQIADFLEISERKVKVLISWYAERSGLRDPLKRTSVSNIVDISELVRRKKDSAGAASLQPPAPLDAG